MPQDKATFCWQKNIFMQNFTYVYVYVCIYIHQVNICLCPDEFTPDLIIHFYRKLLIVSPSKEKNSLFVFPSHKIIRNCFGNPVAVCEAGIQQWPPRVSCWPSVSCPPPFHWWMVRTNPPPFWWSWMTYIYWVWSKGSSVPWIAVTWTCDWHCVVLTHHHHTSISCLLQHPLRKSKLSLSLGCLSACA
jgi:hypothetical protein